MKALTAVGFCAAILLAPVANAADDTILLGKDADGRRHYLNTETVRIADDGRLVMAMFEVRDRQGGVRKVLAAFDCRNEAFVVLQSERYNRKGQHISGTGPGTAGFVMRGTVAETWHAGACALGQALRRVPNEPVTY